MERVHFPLFIALFLIVSFPFQRFALGSGVYLPGNGSRSAGMADAVIAVGDDGDAVIHNPANLGRLRGFGFRFDNQLSFQFAQFLRKPEGKVKYDWVTKKVFPIYIPILSLWYNFKKVGPGSLTLSVFAYAPHGKTGFHYPEEEKPGKNGGKACKKAQKGDAIICDPLPESGPQRTVLIKITSPLVFWGVAAAYEWDVSPPWKLRFGTAFKMAYLGVYQRQSAVVLSSFFDPSSPATTPYEAIMTIDIGGISFTGDLAFSMDFPGGFSFGSSFIFPVSFRAQGELTAEVSPIIGKFANIYGKQLEVETQFPAILRFGLGWRGYGLALELAFVMEFWSILKEFKIRPKDIEIETTVLGKKRSPLPEFSVPQEMNNAFSIRFGAEYTFLKYFSIRAGVLYESNAVPLERLSVNSIDYPKIAVSAGIGFITPWGIRVDVSFLHSFLREFKVENSPILPVDVTPDSLKSKKPLTSPANGTYRYSASIISFGIRGNW